jgi:hypothetical protein
VGRRGADPEDAALFAPDQLATLRTATAELSWLLSRGYAEASAIELVGNRHALRRRQRDAVRRAAAADDAVAARTARRRDAEDIAGEPIAIDGFNCLITLEAALAGAPIFRGRDGAVRDIASVHGNWRAVDTTERALACLADALARLNVGPTLWYLDRPVSRSAELAQTIERLGAARSLPWRTDVVFDPDGALASGTELVATADAGVLDRCGAWFDLVSHVLPFDVPDAWCLQLA